ncbi:MAG: putative transposase [Crocinitomicaceae bacterium]|jgi:putative transposase
MFKRHRYPRVVILHAVYLKLRFTLSYRDLEELLSTRGVQVDHSTVQRWVFKFSPEIEKNMHKRKRSRCAASRLRRSATSEDQTLVPGISK